MAHDVFLSYSSKDKAAAEAVCAALEQRGAVVWVAPRDIAPGASWAGSIVEAIDGARAIVLVFSSAANESGQIEREVQRALEKNLRIIPFRIEDVKPKEALAYCIGAVQWLDAFAPPMEPHYEALAKVVRRTTAPQPEAGAPAAAAAPAPQSAPASAKRRKLAPILIAAAVLVVAGVASLLAWREPSPTPVASQNRTGAVDPAPAATGNIELSKIGPPEAQVANAANASNAANQGDVSKLSPQGAGFGIVFGTDSSPKAAMDEVKKAMKPPISARPVLFKKNGSWASVAPFETQAQAAEQLAKFKGVRSSAFIVDLASWCPSARTLSAETADMAEQRDCGS